MMRKQNITAEKNAVVTSRQTNLIITASILLGAAIFFLDLKLRVGMGIPILYIGVIWLAGSSSERYLAYKVAGACSIATVSVLAISPPSGTSFLTVFTNRFLCLFAIWMTAVLLILLKIEKEKLEKYNDLLEERVHQRTIKLRDAHTRTLHVERLAAIGQMVTGLAHESRNALQRIQSSVNRLYRRTSGDDEIRKIVLDIERAGEDVSRLYEEVKAYVSPITLQMEECNIRNIWQKVWEDLKPSRKERTLEIEEKVYNTDLNSILDVHRIEQVFRNILENSLSACKDPVRIEIICSESQLNTKPAIKIIFADNGPGLNEEQRERIFEPFYTTRNTGTGLGMSIVKRIVEAHGGEISAGNRNGKGAEISIILPKE